METQSPYSQALHFYRTGNLAEAERLCQESIAAETASFAPPLHLLGIIRVRQGRNVEALQLINASLKAYPDSAEALSNYGYVLKTLGRFEEALASFDKALAIDPAYVEGLINRGIVLTALERPEDALASYDKALAIRPDAVEALNNRGTTLRYLKRFEEALLSYEAALAVRPDFVEALYNRGLTLGDLHRYEEALACYEAVLAASPGDAEVLNNQGIAFWSLNRLDEALASYEAALLANPNYAEAWYNRGNILWKLKRFGEALASRERTLASDPNHAYALGAAAAASLHLCDWPRTAKIAGALRSHILEAKSVVSPFVLLGYSDDVSLQFKCAKDNIQHKIPVQSPPLWRGTAHHHDKIHIAYLSADFRQHATAYLMADLFETHDRSRFEVLGISFGENDGSAMRARLVKAFDGFHDVRDKSDHDVAALLKAGNVDIAIDLNGHTQNCRPGILGHRPCPVQVNYLGYPGTMGADFMDYIIADRIVLPFDQQFFFTEKIVHLPDCYQVSDSRRLIAEATPSRNSAGLPECGFVFCCFNGNWKITAPMFDIWMRLLADVPGSVLWLIEENNETSANLRAEATARKIDPQRIIFAARVSPEKHLARHRLADIFLDTLPYNAHTTANDALWAGLPVVTCRGKAFAGRVAASLLQAVGLVDLVTHTLEDYEALARKLAHDAALLQSYRDRLEKNRLISPLFDTGRFRHNIQTAYATMHDIAARGEPPRSFAV